MRNSTVTAKSHKSIVARTQQLIANEPIWVQAFPPEPWSHEDLAEIAHIVETCLLIKNEVITEGDPWVDWLERWKFHNATQTG